MIDEITDHLTVALERAPGTLQEKTNWTNLLTAIINQLQEVETAAHDVLTETTLDNAADDALDQVGKVVGQDRLGLSDAVFRAYCRARIIANQSKTTWEELISICELVINNPSTTILGAYANYKTFRVFLGGDVLDYQTEQVLIDLLNIAKAAGERVILWSNRITEGGELTLGGLAFVTSTVSIGASTVSVDGTDGFPDSGDADFATNTDPFSYTGKTSSTLTGCTGIGVGHAIGERIISINNSSNGLGDTGDPNAGGEMESAVDRKD